MKPPKYDRYVERLMQNDPSTIRFHIIFMHDGIWCGPHCNATKRKSCNEYDHNVYHKGCANLLAIGLNCFQCRKQLWMAFIFMDMLILSNTHI